MAAKVVRCDRCSKRLRRRAFEDSMAQLKDGYIDHYVCEGCLSPEEFVAMEVRAELMELGITPDGRILTRPKYKLPA